MVFSISYWALAGIIFLAWNLHVFLSKKPSVYIEEEWDFVKQLLVAQANRLFTLLLCLPVAWVGHKFFVFGHSLVFIVWIIRVYAAYVSIKQLFFFFIGLSSLEDVGGKQTTLSNLIISLTFALVALSI